MSMQNPQAPSDRNVVVYSLIGRPKVVAKITPASPMVARRLYLIEQKNGANRMMDHTRTVAARRAARLFWPFTQTLPQGKDPSK